MGKEIRKEPWRVDPRWYVDGSLGVTLPSRLMIKIAPVVGSGNQKEKREQVEKEVVPFLKAGFNQEERSHGTPPSKKEINDLIKALKRGARECEKEGVDGWGNAMQEAADMIKDLRK